VADQILSAEDRLEVMELIARYSRTLDTADIDQWLTIWRPEASLFTLNGEAHGHQQLRDWAVGLFENRGVGASPPKVIHFAGLPLIEGHGNRCTALTYTIILDYDADGGVEVAMLGRYDDEFVKLDGRWWIESRTISSDLSRSS
jgi:hypothetical protein